MHLSTLLFPLSLSLALGAPLDHTSTNPAPITATIPPSPNSLVVLSVFNDAECRSPGAGLDVNGGQLDIESEDKCFGLGGGGGGNGTTTTTTTSEGGGEEEEGEGKWGGLRVVWAHEKLRYNSLRVYESLDCSGPWTLQPIRCGTDDGTCACSRISTYNSIKLEVM